MDAIKGHIKTTATVMIIVLVALCLATVIITAVNQAEYYEAWRISEVTGTNPHYWLMVISPYLRAGTYAFLAFIFIQIRREMTPFTKGLSRLLKAFAIVFFIVQCLPEFLYTILTVLNPVPIQGNLPILFLSVSVALVISFTIYSFALIFQYGALLQDDSNAIV